MRQLVTKPVPKGPIRDEDAEFFTNRELLPLLQQMRSGVNSMRTVSALLFGADPTGRKDSATAILAARDYLAENGGGTIYLPPGTYIIGSPLVFGNDIFVQGGGRTATILSLHLDAVTDGLTWNIGSQYGSGGGVRDIKIHVDNPNLVRDAVSARSWDGWNSSNALIEGAGRYGLLMSDGLGTSMIGVKMRSNVSAGLWIGTTIGSVPTTQRFFGCDFFNTSNGPGVSVDSGIGLAFYGCFFDSNGSDTSAGSPDGNGMLINQGIVSLHGCYFENNARHDVLAGVIDGTFLYLSNPTIVSGPYKTHGLAGVHGAGHLNGGGWHGGDCSAGGLGQSLTLSTGDTNFDFIGVKISTPAQRPTYNGSFANLHNYPGFIWYMDPATGTPTCSGLRALITDLDVGSTLSVNDNTSGRVGIGIDGGSAARKLHVRGAASNDGIQADAPAGAANRATVILNTIGHLGAGISGTENAASNGTHLDLLAGTDAGGAGRVARCTDLGSVVIGTGTNPAVLTTATDGFIYIPVCDGPPTGVPTVQAGTAAIVWDRTNNALYVNDGGGWVGGINPGVFL